MKQLKFDFEKGNDDYVIPDFETWYAENSNERKTFGETPYNRMKATSVYADLIESNFFKRGK